MINLTDNLQEWISAHANDDTIRLRLRHHGDASLAFAIAQIERRRKGTKRFPKALACPGFVIPTSLAVEQATSEAIASTHADIIGESRHHLDLTCGLGIDAFEMARRGTDVTALDINPEVAQAANHNARVLGLSELLHPLCADSEIFLRDAGNREWDSIFIDPARRSADGHKLVALSECEPNVTVLLSKMLKLAPLVVVKASPMLDVTAIAGELNSATTLGQVRRVIAIGTATECKEVVAVVIRGYHGPTLHEAITLLPGTDMPVIFEVSSEAGETKLPSIPSVGDFLYEPFPAVMKTGAWAQLATLAPTLAPLHPNTHLFVSKKEIVNFPGIAMKVEMVAATGGKALRSVARDYPVANVTTRNFIMSAPALAKKLRVKEGGYARIYGVRAGIDEDPMIVVASPLS
ncbi:MAG: class I SAM-dependent methyltransferase [Pseudoflavonifractor sp.]|nr:class I SAM-dependent methyltransferase [Alloprevotella sp.]MCM1117237.1 class I SAM-dependent methyltransferase [Pseudoflavonifractor sp.]